MAHAADGHGRGLASRHLAQEEGLRRRSLESNQLFYRFCFRCGKGALECSKRPAVPPLRETGEVVNLPKGPTTEWLSPHGPRRSELHSDSPARTRVGHIPSREEGTHPGVGCAGFRAATIFPGNPLPVKFLFLFGFGFGRPTKSRVHCGRPRAREPHPARVVSRRHHGSGKVTPERSSTTQPTTRFFSKAPRRHLVPRWHDWSNPREPSCLHLWAGL